MPSETRCILVALCLLAMVSCDDSRPVPILELPMKAPFCGDGVVEGEEECEPSLNPACVNCRIDVCGNGFKSLAEACDDGNTEDGDDCPSDCSRCGDGMVGPTEGCDDGNTNNGDGCSARCEICGDGILSPHESCDDGNMDPDDGCDRCASRNVVSTGLITARGVVSYTVDTEGVYFSTEDLRNWMTYAPFDGRNRIDLVETRKPNFFQQSIRGTGLVAIGPDQSVYASRPFAQNPTNALVTRFVSPTSQAWTEGIGGFMGQGPLTGDGFAVLNIEAKNNFVLFSGVYRDIVNSSVTRYTTMGFLTTRAAELQSVVEIRFDDIDSFPSSASVSEDGRFCIAGVSNPDLSTALLEKHWLACYSPLGEYLWGALFDEKIYDIEISTAGDLLHVLMARADSVIDMSSWERTRNDLTTYPEPIESLEYQGEFILYQAQSRYLALVDRIGKSVRWFSDDFHGDEPQFVNGRVYLRSTAGIVSVQPDI